MQMESVDVDHGKESRLNDVHVMARDRDDLFAKSKLEAVGQQGLAERNI